MDRWNTKKTQNISLYENSKGTVVDTDYHNEFSVPVKAGESTFTFSVEAVKKDGEVITTKQNVIGVVQ
jgi:hypothetical protein